jgi:DNA-binding MarR family transcriptional regulator
LAGIELTFLMGLGFQVVLAEFVHRANEAGYADLRPVHGAAFQALKAGGATGTELAERLGVTKQAAGQIADELESKGYVRREPHPQGGRRRLIVLTQRGEAHLRDAGRILHELEREIGARLGHDRLRELRVQLARLIRDRVGDDVPPLRPLW